MKNLKDKLTDWLAIAVIIAEVVYEFLISETAFNWKQFIASLLLAFILYVTGKSHNLKKKKAHELASNIDTTKVGQPGDVVKENSPNPPTT